MDELLRFGRETMTHSMMKGPYENHYYRLGSVVRNTVNQAQDTLRRMSSGDYHHKWSDWRLANPDWTVSNYIVTHHFAVTQPKSLGELCIELAQDKMAPRFCEETPDGLGVMTGNYYYPGIRRDIQKLRETMWHTHIDPEKERKTAKLERLIELVRNA